MKGKKKMTIAEFIRKLGKKVKRLGLKFDLVGGHVVAPNPLGVMFPGIGFGGIDFQKADRALGYARVEKIWQTAYEEGPEFSSLRRRIDAVTVNRSQEKG